MEIKRVQGQTVVELDQVEALGQLNWWIKLTSGGREQALSNGTLTNIQMDQGKATAFTPVPAQDLKSLLLAAHIARILHEVVGQLKQARYHWDESKRECCARVVIVDTVAKTEQFGDVELSYDFIDTLLKSAEMEDQDELKKKLLVGLKRADLLTAETA